MNKNIKKICFVMEDVHGGVVMSITNLIDYFDSDNAEFGVCLIATPRNKPTNVVSELFIKRKVICDRVNHAWNDNKYYLLKRIADVLKKYDLVVCCTPLELEAINRFKLKPEVVFAVHGDIQYVFNLAMDYKGLINKYFPVSQHIANKLNRLLVNRTNDIIYIPHAIPPPLNLVRADVHGPFKIVFVGRFDQLKGFYDVVQITNALKAYNANKFHFTFISSVTVDLKFDRLFSDLDHVEILSELSANDLHQKLENAHINLLPSRLEGFPLTLVETMYHGIVPLVSNLESGIPEIVHDNQTGFRFSIGEIDGYVQKISELESDRKIWDDLSRRAQTRVLEMFNPKMNSRIYLENLEIILNSPINKEFRLKAGFYNGMDHWLIPNKVVKIVRLLKNKAAYN